VSPVKAPHYCSKIILNSIVRDSRCDEVESISSNGAGYCGENCRERKRRSAFQLRYVETDEHWNGAQTSYIREMIENAKTWHTLLSRMEASQEVVEMGCGKKRDAVGSESLTLRRMAHHRQEIWIRLTHPRLSMVD
jgi:hypothetical protein